MQADTRKPSAVAWVEPLLAHLRRIQPKRTSTNGTLRGDIRAFAALRAAARGQRFVLQALPHVVPHLGESHQDPSPRVVEQAIALAQLYATMPPEEMTTVQKNSAHDAQRGGDSVGKRMGRANATDNAKTGAASSGSGEEKHLPTNWERRLQALVRVDSKRLVRELRGTLGLIAKEIGGMTFDDYGRLGHDLVYWDNPKKTIQMQWVTDFYTQTGNRAEQDINDKETNNE